MGAYDRFKTADVMGVRQYIEPGTHVLLVKRTEQGKSKNPKHKGAVEKTVVEFKVLKSDTMKEGCSCSLVEMETNQGYFGNVLAFTAGILGNTIDEMRGDADFDEVFSNAYGEAQILVGMLVKCVAQQVATTSTGAKSPEYTAKSWEPVDAADYEDFGLVAPPGAWTAHGEGAEAAAAAE